MSQRNCHENVFRSVIVGSNRGGYIASNTNGHSYPIRWGCVNIILVFLNWIIECVLQNSINKSKRISSSKSSNKISLSLLFSTCGLVWIVFAYIFFKGQFLGKSRIVRFHDCNIILKRLSFYGSKSIKIHICCSRASHTFDFVHIISNSLCKISYFWTVFDPTPTKTATVFLSFFFPYSYYIYHWCRVCFFFYHRVKNKNSDTM